MGRKAFTRMGQIGIAVSNIDYAQKICRNYGFGPMRSFITTDKSVQNCELYGKSIETMRFKTLMCDLNEVTFEFLEPVDDSTVWKRFIEEHGEGICDIMFTPTKDYYDILKERGIKEIMKFDLYNHYFSENDFFREVMRMHDTYEDLGFNVFSWDQNEISEKRIYPRDYVATGAYVILEDGSEPYLAQPKYERIEKIIIVSDKLEKMRENYEAYGFEGFSEIETVGNMARKISFPVKTDREDIIFELVEPTDMESPYGRFLKQRGKGVYNVIFKQNEKFLNVIDTMIERR